MGWDMNGGRQDGHTEMFFLNQNTFFQLTVLTGVTIILIDFVHIVYQDLICHLVVNPLLPWTISAYFFDDEISERVVLATNTYAEDKKDSKPSMYRRFKQKQLTKKEMMHYLGVLLLLGINTIRNYRQAWNIKSSQVSSYS